MSTPTGASSTPPGSNAAFDRKTYSREYMRRRLEDPEYRKQHNERAKEYQRKKRLSDPDYVAKASEQRKERQATDPVYAEKVRQRQNLKNRKRKLKAVEYKGGRCVDCKGVFPPAVYDFHHLDPATKEMHPGHAIAGTWERAKAELDKCVLLCANCHRTRHATESLN